MFLLNVKNLVGQRFGRLVVEFEIPRQKKMPSQKWYHCKCDCGNGIDLYTSLLTSGAYRSCGCLQRENRLQDITGERRGYLTAIRPTGKIRNGSAEWEWRCDCGKVIKALERNVGPGRRKSCGCMREVLNQEQAREMHEKLKPSLVEGTNLKTIASSAMYSSNTSGVRGVSWHKRRKKWQARITFRGRTISLGYYDNLDDAQKARERAEEEMFVPMLEKHKDGAE